MTKDQKEIYTHQLCVTYRDKIKLSLLDVDAKELEFLYNKLPRFRKSRIDELLEE